MSNDQVSNHPEPAHLQRRFGLLQATALNMSNMVGVGPFITIPLIMSAMVGPQAMLGWGVAFVITLADGMIWSELGAAIPGSGGSYLYLREGFGRETFGRLMAFLFIWQFIFSGPLEIASGYIGFANYLGYVWRMEPWQAPLVAAGVGLLNLFLLYRQITAIGKITVTLWVGTLATMLIVVLTGAWTFDPRVALRFPPGAFSFGLGFFLGLGAASRLSVYDYLGYYDICYIGEEVRDPGRVIPRSILTSLVVVAVLYAAINLSVIGVIRWEEFVPADDNPLAKYIVSVFIERVYGRPAAIAFTLLILWTAMASVFALLLGYSRIPFAAARDGYFFKVFSKLHPTKAFPHVSLLVIGVLAMAATAFSLEQVIEALVTMRIIVQFMGQAVAVMLLRRRAPEMERPYRIWLYPLPNLLALAGWTFVFATSGALVMLLAGAVLVAGILFFLIWARYRGGWPFAPGGK